MSIEAEIFKKATADFAKVEAYGFKKQSDGYRLEKTFMDESFRADIHIDANGKVSGSVYDVAADDEYTLFRVDGMTSGFAGEVRKNYEQILETVKAECFCVLPFLTAQANRLSAEIKNKYGDDPQFMFKRLPSFGVFKNPQTNKWYAMIMNAKTDNADKAKGEEIEILHIKLTDKKTEILSPREGLNPSFNKHWRSIVLDGILSDDEIMEFIDKSHTFTVKKVKKSASETL